MSLSDGLAPTSNVVSFGHDAASSLCRRLRSYPYRIGVMAGDGIGPEVVASAMEVVDAACDRYDCKLEWIPLPVGWEALNQTGSALPQETIDALEDCDGWLLGPLDFVTYPDPRLRNPSAELRRHFQLFANVRPAKSFSGVPSLVDDADLVIVRENTEGFYADRNMATGSGDLRITNDVALAVGVFTRRGIARVMMLACELAERRRKHVTIVHKANVLPQSMGLYLEEARAVAADFDVVCDDFHADAMAALLVRRCRDFDVIVCENLLGDLFSDLAGELTGSIGLSPALNQSRSHAMAQAAHGAAPDIAGRNEANPVGEILSMRMLLTWLGQKHDDGHPLRAGDAIEYAVIETLSDGVATPDIGGAANTSTFTAELVKRIRKQ